MILCFGILLFLKSHVFIIFEGLYRKVYSQQHKWHPKNVSIAYKMREPILPFRL